MKNKEKKTPKSAAKEYILSTDAESILYGLILILLSLIGLLNNGIVGEALTYIFAYLFGVFYILVYLLFIFLGLYLMIKKTMLKVHIDLKILGGLLLVVGFCIAASMGQNLTINNFFSVYQNQVSNTQKYIFSMISADAIYSNLGGGIIGYFLTGSLNSAVSETGTAIIVFIFVIVGLILLFKDLAIKVIKFIINYRKKRKEVRLQEQLEKQNITPNETRAVFINNNEVTVTSKEEKQSLEPISFNSLVEPKREKASDILENLSNDELNSNLNIDNNQDINNQTDNNSQYNNQILEEYDNAIYETNDDIKKIDISEFINDDIPEDDSVVENKDYSSPIEEVVENQEVISQSTSIDEHIDNNSVESEQVLNKTLPYVYPSLSLLKDRFNYDETSRKNALAREKMNLINECFNDLGIGASVVSYTIGPSVTRFDVKMNNNVRTNVLSSIENDLAVRLGGNRTVRLETIVDGKSTSGIEVGNEISDVVSFKECMAALENNQKDKLLFPLGKGISGNIVSCCLDEMPHLLVCGTTGSGKSVFIHNIICSLIMRNKPEELKLMLIDPKRIEFTKYQGIAHLLCPIITSTDRGKVALMKLVDEMERRYDLFAEKGRGASNYKEYIETCEEMGYEKIPYIVMICDEFADFMTDGDKEVAKLIQRIAQKARACGIYMVIATQRPSVKVITGEIKANIPSRIALSVSSQTDSRIIIDEQGAENLLGKGDLLARVPNSKFLLRVQSAFIDSKEIFAICEHIRSQREFVCDPNFEDLTLKVVSPFASVNSDIQANGVKSMFRDYHTDEKFEEIKRFVISTGKCSTTKLQNTFGIGFSRADGILDTLEADGIIKKEGNRRVLVNSSEIQNYDGDDE